MSEKPAITYCPPGYAADITPAQSARPRFQSDTIAAHDHHASAPHHYGERALWQGVLLQALEDIGKAHGPDRFHAIAWASMGNRDFRLVCEWAGFDPAHVIKAVARISAARASGNIRSRWSPRLHPTR